MHVEIQIHGGRERKRVERRFVSGPLSVGRDAGNVLCLEDDHVSRRHAVLHCGPSGLTIVDQSRNGTVAGERMLLQENATVAYGTPILLGLHTLYVRPVSPLEPPGVVSAEAGATGSGPGPAPASAEEPVADTVLRREIHRRLREHLAAATLDSRRVDDVQRRPRVLTALRRIIDGLAARLPPRLDVERLAAELADEALGLGPLDSLLADPGVSEIMVIDPVTIYVEREGKLETTDARFTDDEHVRAVIERIVAPLGHRVDESTPLVDARLPDGSRVNAIIPPAALRGSCIRIRKPRRVPLTLDDLYRYRALTEPMGRLLSRCVVAKRNILISGGAGSGKTTLLNVLAGAIPADERIITIEDAAELRLAQPHVVSLETRPPSVEGKGDYTVRDLLENALRMWPDRIVVGECRGNEALDMLRAMNTGHDGSLSTIRANSPAEALARLETLASTADGALPTRAIRESIAASVHLVVQQCRLSDGSRKTTEIAELVGVGADGELQLRPIYRFVRTGTTPDARVLGEFSTTGHLPSSLPDLCVRGLMQPGEAYL